MSRFLATARPKGQSGTERPDITGSGPLQGPDTGPAADAKHDDPLLPLSIGKVKLENAVFLAPMSGVTDLPFRRMARRFGVGAVVSEMVAADGLIARDFEHAIRLEGEGISPHIVQLAGCDAGVMAEGARIAESSGADVVDINMGCPAKRVNNRLSGSALMRDLDHAVGLIEAVVAAVRIPVSVKMRLGWDENSLNAAGLARRAEAAGVQLIQVHARTRSQFYRGMADWTRVRAVTEAVCVPVVVNGDIVDPASARLALARSGAKGVMIGRGAVGQPWVPGHVAAALSGAPLPLRPEAGEIGALAVELHEAMLAHYGERLGIRMARKHLAGALELHAVPGGEALKAEILTSEQPQAIAGALREWFARFHDLSPTSQTRTAA